MSAWRGRWTLNAAGVRKAVDEGHTTQRALASELGVGSRSLDRWLAGGPVSPAARQRLLAHPLLKSVPNLLTRADRGPEASHG